MVNGWISPTIRRFTIEDLPGNCGLDDQLTGESSKSLNNEEDGHLLSALTIFPTAKSSHLVEYAFAEDVPLSYHKNVGCRRDGSVLQAFRCRTHSSPFHSLYFLAGVWVARQVLYIINVDSDSFTHVMFNPEVVVGTTQRWSLVFPISCHESGDFHTRIIKGMVQRGTHKPNYWLSILLVWPQDPRLEWSKTVWCSCGTFYCCHYCSPLAAGFYFL